MVGFLGGVTIFSCTWMLSYDRHVEIGSYEGRMSGNSINKAVDTGRGFLV